MFVKICGITRLHDAALAVELGADAIGFVFWRHSPRCIEPAAARAILNHLSCRCVAVGVFVNETEERVNAISRQVGLDAVQLHGDESAGYCARIDRPVIRAFAVGVQVDEEGLARVPPSALLLLDVMNPERRGGTGEPVDWRTAAAIARQRPTILAGGLRPDNVADAMIRVRPFGVDVSSGVESAHGIKDPRKLEAFLAAVLGSGLQDGGSR
jgi:phosphoribosylanthranilate isomerase